MNTKMLVPRYYNDYPTKENKRVEHLAGIVPIAGPKLEFDFPWHDYLMPIGKNCVAVENAVYNCAIAGCDTIWIICHTDVQPVIKKRMGNSVIDPNSIYKKMPHIRLKHIPIFYIPVHRVDKEKKDGFSWNCLYAAKVINDIVFHMSRWLVPERYFVSYPYGVYDPKVLYDCRADLRNINGFFMSYSGKTVKDNEYLPFTFSVPDFRASVKRVNSLIKSNIKEELSLLERMEASRNIILSSNDVFGDVDFRKAKEFKLNEFYNIDNWDLYTKYMTSDLSKKIKKYDSLFDKINIKFVVEEGEPTKEELEELKKELDS